MLYKLRKKNNPILTVPGIIVLGASLYILGFMCGIMLN